VPNPDSIVQTQLSVDGLVPRTIHEDRSPPVVLPHPDDAKGVKVEEAQHLPAEVAPEETPLTVTEKETVTCTKTETLFIPVFRRDRYVLGEIYGNLSPNERVLQLLSLDHRSFVSITRRFVANLSIDNCLEYVEYEWFEKGILVVVAHTLMFDGTYRARYVVFGPDDGEAGVLRIPSTVLLTLSFVETPDCPTCTERDVACHCEDPIRWNMLPRKKPSSWSWSQWIGGLYNFQCGQSTGRVNFTVVSPYGEVRRSFALRLERRGITRDVRSTKALLLSYQYASMVSADKSFPVMDFLLLDNGYRRDPHDSSGALDVPQTSESKMTSTNVTEDELSSSKAKFLFTLASRFYESTTKSWDSNGKVQPHSEARGPMRAVRKQYSCSCGTVFSHLGHYNAHRMAVHMKCARS
jgi:hypothetical protein